jgi:hypothetical protein
MEAKNFFCGFGLVLNDNDKIFELIAILNKWS